MLPQRIGPSAGRAGAPIPSLPWASALGFVVAMILLAGCAPIQPARAPRAGSVPDSGAHPDSAATPPKKEPGEVEPPSSSAIETPAPSVTRVLVVKASAYNSRRGQTDSTPSTAAWGDRLVPGMRVIAVSKDLIELGLRRGQRVRISGLEGEYVVLDRMPSRWRQKIDIYMGVDVRAAIDWGVREVEISWQPARADLEAGDALDAMDTVAAESD